MNDLNKRRRSQNTTKQSYCAPGVEPRKGQVGEAEENRHLPRAAGVLRRHGVCGWDCVVRGEVMRGSEGSRGVCTPLCDYTRSL